MASVHEFSGQIKRANDWLKEDLDISHLKFKNTFCKAKKMGIDLNNTKRAFKKDGVIWIVVVMRFKSVNGNFRETINTHPYLILKK